MPTPNEGHKPPPHKKHVARLQREQQQTKIILYIFLAIIIIVVGLLSYGYYDEKYLQPNKPVATVGDVNIPTHEFQARVRLEERSLLQSYQLYQQYQQFGFDVSAQLNQIQQSLSSPAVLGQTVLDQMINEEIIRQEAAKRGISVSEDEIDAKVRELYEYFPNGTPTPAPEQATATAFITPTYVAETIKLLTPKAPLFTATSIPATATLIPATETIAETPASATTEQAGATPTAESTLTATPTNVATATAAPTSTPAPTATPYTEEGFKKALQENIDGYATLGITEANYRKLVETDLLRVKIYEIITKDMTAEVDQVWARHILVGTEDEAKIIRERLVNGEDFFNLALELSKDPGSAESGGDLGWFGRGAMVAPFEDAAFALKVGEISQPVQSDFGFHIIQLLARQNRPVSDVDLTSAKDSAFRTWLEESRTTFGVETFDLWMNVLPTQEPAQ